MSKDNDVDNVVISNTSLKEDVEKLMNTVKKNPLPQRSEKLKPITTTVKEPTVSTKKIPKPKTSTLGIIKPIVSNTNVITKEAVKKTDYTHIVKILKDIKREQTEFIIKQDENYEFNRTNLLPIVYQFKEMLKDAHAVMDKTNIKLTSIINELNEE